MDNSINDSLAMGFAMIAASIVVALAVIIHMNRQASRDVFCFPFQLCRRRRHHLPSPSSSDISLQTFTVISTPSDQPSTLIATSAPTPIPSLTPLGTIPNALIIPPQPRTPPPTPRQSQLPVPDDFWADTNTIDPDFHRPGVPVHLRATPIYPTHSRWSSLSDLSLSFPSPPRTALLRPETGRTDIPASMLRSPTPSAATSAEYLLEQGSRWVRNRLQFSLRSQVLHDLLEVLRAAVRKSPQFSMV